MSREPGFREETVDEILLQAFLGSGGGPLNVQRVALEWSADPMQKGLLCIYLVVVCTMLESHCEVCAKIHGRDRTR
jgi:hypothetical protein